MNRLATLLSMFSVMVTMICSDEHALAANLQSQNNLSDVQSASVSLGNLGGFSAGLVSSISAVQGKVPEFGNFDGAGVPYLDTSNRLILTNLIDGSSGLVSNLEIYKNALNETAPGITFSITAQTTAGANHTDQEWNAYFKTATSGTKSAYALALTDDVIKTSGNDETWGILNQNQDETDEASSSAGPDLGEEADISANKADDGVNSATFGGYGLRKMIQFAFNQQNQSDSSPTEFSSGLWAGVDPKAWVDQFAGFSPGSQIINAFDCRGITEAKNAGIGFNPICINMTAGDYIDFAGGSSLKSAPQDALSYNSTDAAWEFNSGTAVVFKLGTTGLFTSTGGISNTGTLTNNGALVVAGTLQGGGTVPIVAVGAGAGNSATATVSGNSLDGVLTLNTGTAPTASAILATITLGETFPSTAICTFAPANAPAAYTGTQAVYITSSSTTLIFNTDSLSLTASRTYKWNYICAG